MYVVARDLVESLSVEAETSGADAVLSRLPAAPVPFTRSNHYLAFALAFLEESGLLVQVDTDGTRRLADQSARMVEVYSPESTVIHAELAFSDDELLDDFHGGGQLSDPNAKVALHSAIDALRRNLLALDGDQVLIVEL